MLILMQNSQALSDELFITGWMERAEDTRQPQRPEPVSGANL